MFDAQIVLALFAAFLLGIVVGSGMEIIVRSGRYWIPALIAESAHVSIPFPPRDAGAPAAAARATGAFSMVGSIDRDRASQASLGRLQWAGNLPAATRLRKSPFLRALGMMMPD